MMGGGGGICDKNKYKNIKFGFISKIIGLSALFLFAIIFCGNFCVATNSALNAKKTAIGTIVFTTYSINLNADDGVAQVSTNVKKSLPNRTITINIQTQLGYSIESLTCTTTGGQNINLNSVENNQFTFVMPESDVAISVTTKPNSYVVTFDANGGDVNVNSINVTYNDIFNTLPNATKFGYEFLGWFTSKTGGEQILATTVVTITSDVTLYAKYTANEYRIVYDRNGATSGEMTNVTVTYDAVTQLKSNTYAYESKITLNYGDGRENDTLISTRPFKGWYASSVGGSFGATSALGSSVDTTATLISDGSYIKNLADSGDVTLTAQWGDSTKVTLPTPTRSKYKFLYWCYIATNGNAIIIKNGQIGTDSNITLYAEWMITEIETADDLIEFAQTVNGTRPNRILNFRASYKDETVTLKNDITLNDISNVDSWGNVAPSNIWTPIGYYNSDSDNFAFMGTFDGGNHAISGIYVNSSTLACQGLFAETGNTSIIKNVIIRDSYIKAGAYVGGIVGYCEDAQILGCTNYATVISVGKDDEPNDCVGGIVGGMAGTTGSISDCKNYGNISSAKDSLGGIAGRIVTSKISNCVNYGVVNTTTGRGAGGIVGFIQGNGLIEGCYSDTSSKVVATSNVGGVVGYTYNIATKIEITKCYNKGTVSTIETATNSDGYIGGVVGYLCEIASITDSYNSGKVTHLAQGGQGVGGVVGQNYCGTISKCYNTGEVEGHTGVGGVVGYNSGTTYQCYNNGAVIGYICIGGVVGYVDANYDVASVNNCYNTGSVSANEVSAGSQNRIGGVIGQVYLISEKTLTINNVYNLGTVTGYNYIGGIMGIMYNNGVASSITLKDSFNAGNIITKTSDPIAGGIIGVMYNDSTTTSNATLTIQNCVNMGTITGSGTYSGAIADCCYNASTGTIVLKNFYIKSSSSYTHQYYVRSTNTGTITQTGLKQGSVTLTMLSTFKSTTYWSSSTSWDFTNIWKISSSINGGYPVFNWQ